MPSYIMYNYKKKSHLTCEIFICDRAFNSSTSFECKIWDVKKTRLVNKLTFICQFFLALLDTKASLAAKQEHNGQEEHVTFGKSYII